MEPLVSLCKRRGIIFQSSEIYGGLNGCWDYGPVGVLLKKNLKEAWWRDMVQTRNDMVGIDCSILMHPQTWTSSGHVKNFSDPMVDCKECKKRWAADKAFPYKKDPRGQVKGPVNLTPLEAGGVCPECSGELTEARQFNLMFKTFIGPVEDESNSTFLRPETAQGIFVNFKNVMTTTRKKLPFGIAQIGKSFRNEITPRNFTFRTREFEQMEIEFFVKPGEDEEWQEFWVKERFNWYLRLGMREESIRLRPHAHDELAHYAKSCVDIEYQFPFGYSELEGIANRTDYDLTNHIDGSGKDLKCAAEAGGKADLIPFVIEPSGGVDRATLAFLADAYREEPEPGKPDETRVVLKFHPRLAPYKAAVLPLSKKEELMPMSMEIADKLRRRFEIDFDATQSIGKRYRRQDEIGTPFCITVDFDSLNDGCVTVRERDSMNQVRISAAEVVNYITKSIDES
ncbi:MAG: glycine--tRNA ligase [Candidatus Wallbacteria bacterium HGW-Wallbacteria-1]|uniref:Glycine--tRNA ligase n=1 Tax=Candidatus Wallbacteria bacterium HGW-Wallbacteria-1 TaxID=2013854 RepID=A0A2N1PT88_9BACT|nr:MAG: glycine--tRNA ligase [Candidatus Wallbacteria bacterium HGW-Wallbacteria-1]